MKFILLHDTKQYAYDFHHSDLCMKIYDFLYKIADCPNNIILYTSDIVKINPQDIISTYFGTKNNINKIYSSLDDVASSGEREIKLYISHYNTMDMNMV